MIRLTRSIIDFLSVLFLTGSIGLGLSLFASEVKLAALKKASYGTGGLADFTEKMTRVRILK